MRFRRPILIAAAALLVGSALVACGGSEETESASKGEAVPLADSLDTLEPRPVWQHFYDLTQVPRPSHHEAKATAFVADFGRSLGLDTTVDDVGNVIIRKPATKGMEGRPGVVLQAHLDMVPQKTSGLSFNFETDPIDAVAENGWVHAKGTTLGADDGIGVALIMALLGANDIEHGPVETLFTVNEEDGTTGIRALPPDVLKGRLYINVDNETEGTFVNSSAGSVSVNAHQTYPEVATPTGTTAREVTIDGLLGGHSGIDIDKGRGSAHQLMARLIVDAPADLGVRVANVVGGEIPNAIPSTATALVVVPTDKADAFDKYVDDFSATVAKELADTDPDVEVSAKSADAPEKLMDPASQKAIIQAVYDAPQGVYAMSKEDPDLVETSGNLGVLSIRDGKFAATAYPRSSVDSERDSEARRYVDVFEKAGAKVELENATPAWPPNPDSPLLALMTQVYRDTFGKSPKVEGVHAGLETSWAGSKYPDMDMLSVGPTLEGVHSPDVRLEVASVPKVYDLLVATLARIE